LCLELKSAPGSPPMEPKVTMMFAFQIKMTYTATRFLKIAKKNSLYGICGATFDIF